MGGKVSGLAFIEKQNKPFLKGEDRLENLQELEDEGEVYESIEDIWPDYPTQEDFLFTDDEY